MLAKLEGGLILLITNFWIGQKMQNIYKFSTLFTKSKLVICNSSDFIIIFYYFEDMVLGIVDRWTGNGTSILNWPIGQT
jgi:hypothetical protein